MLSIARFVFLLALAAYVPTITGLAFLTSSLRTQTAGGPFAALTLRSQVGIDPSVSQKGYTNDVSKETTDGIRKRDETRCAVQATRSEMVDIVYQRSLQRLNSFYDEE